ncbi:beta barrel domain-containing protein [Bacillus stercoris]|uniref:beta barrel domain-containing protein n=1 Tax=Bacillus stercoris TaxID=2054641 RepID=UPI00403330AD
MDKSQLIKVGSTVYLKPINNAARYGRKDILEKVVLKKGRKYFYVGNTVETETRRMFKFSLEDMREVTEYSPDWELYLSKQEIIDKEEKKKLMSDIRSVFDRWSTADLTLDQLRRVHEIISE